MEARAGRLRPHAARRAAGDRRRLGRSARPAATILKSIAATLDWPPLRPPLRDFIDWVARWTLSPRGMVLRMAIRAGEVAAPPAPKFGLVATGKAPARMTDARARVMAAVADARRANAQSGARGARRLIDRA